MRWGSGVPLAAAPRLVCTTSQWACRSALLQQVGLLYLTDAGRLHELMVHLGLAVEEEGAGED